MDESEWLASHFERYQPHLRAVAYQMLGSGAEADYAVQDTWLRLCRSGGNDAENLRVWLTTIVARVCLNMLGSRDDPRGDHRVVSRDGDIRPEEQALLADSVGLALLVVLDTLTPDERLAFVMHDMFELPFDEIAPMVSRSPAAASELASRARQRVRSERS
jgi:RNA polymerase sigma factor (sigma-70 family)